MDRTGEGRQKMSRKSRKIVDREFLRHREKVFSSLFSNHNRYTYLQVELLKELKSFCGNHHYLSFINL